MEISLQAQVECTDGVCGSSDYILINPVIKQVTHLVVRETSSPNTEYIVPVDLVSAPIAGTIQLRCSKAELEKMDPFITTESVEEKVPAFVGYSGYGFGTYPYRPYVNPEMNPSIKTEFVEEKVPAIVGYGGHGFGTNSYRPFVNPEQTVQAPVEQRTVQVLVEDQQIPSGELAVSRDTHVEATDGYVGKVDEFVVSSENSQITNLVMREGHLWRQKDVIIPISAMADIRKDAVSLKLDKRQIESLRTFPVHRLWS